MRGLNLREILTNVIMVHALACVELMHGVTSTAGRINNIKLMRTTTNKRCLIIESTFKLGRIVIITIGNTISVIESIGVQVNVIET